PHRGAAHRVLHVQLLRRDLHPDSRRARNQHRDLPYLRLPAVLRADQAGRGDHHRGVLAAGPARLRRVLHPRAEPLPGARMSVQRPAAWPWRARRVDVLAYVLVMLVVAFVILPFSWMVSIGFKAPHAWFVTPPRLIPERPTLDNYLGALDPAFLRYAFNSILVSSVTTVVTLVFAVFSAYAFSRLRFPGRRQVFTLIILTQLLPLVVLIIP